MMARIFGVLTKVQTFSFFYGLQLVIVVISHSDNHSSNLQRAEMCSGCLKECQALCHCSLSIRSDMNASFHWTEVTKLELQAPSIPHHRTMLSRYFEGNAQHEHLSNGENFYCQIYFETVDTVANCIE